MYRLLKDHLPGPLPELIMAVWYTFLLMLVVMCASFPLRPFLYLGL
jgi:hypothetical protein